ncbi:MAG: transporter substrate-binding domain-containing protein [Comamonadaceae bacterium]|nr:transporter substrate-binding domain-containing protein [Comamonadaceae bacterium]
MQIKISFRGFKRFGLALLGLCALPAALQAQSGGTLEKIRQSGKVVIGVRESSAPMAYRVSGGQREFVGYHVELCEKVLAQIAPQAKIEYMALTSQNTLPLIQNGTVDLGCGPTTNNQARQKQVAFALTTYVSEVRMAVKADSGIASFQQLAGQTVAASAGTTAVQLLRKYGKQQQIDFETLLGKDHFESFLLLSSGRARAFVLDDNLLAGVVANSPDPKGYKITGEVLGSEPIALVLRKDDPAFKQAVDQVLAGLMRSGELAQLYDKWFMQPIPPKNVALNLPMGQTLKALLENPNDKPLEEFRN